MAYVIWKDSFNIGVWDMDEQHKLFISYINELYDALQLRNAEGIVMPILDKLLDYVGLHFAAEEDMLGSVNYPMIETQKKQHAYYVSEILSLKKSFSADAQTSQNLLLFLRDWFLHHIMTEDLKYVEFVEKIDAEPKL